MFQALERALDVTNTGPLRLLTDYQTPAAIRRAGVTRLTKWLANRKVPHARALAETDKPIEGRFREQELADILLSVPGIGAIRGAEFLAAIGGDLDEFDSPDALAAFAGTAPAPAPRDSGKVSGDLHRPLVYHRRLQRVVYTSALVSVRQTRTRGSSTTANAPRARSTSKPCSLARRRVNAIWALIRDRRCYEVTPPVTTAA